MPPAPPSRLARQYDHDSDTVEEVSVQGVFEAISTEKSEVVLQVAAADLNLTAPLGRLSGALVRGELTGLVARWDRECRRNGGALNVQPLDAAWDLLQFDARRPGSSHQESALGGLR